MDTILETKDLCVQYKASQCGADRKLAVKGHNLKVQAGEVFGFLGPNGAGKTTTMNVLLGFVTATSGAVLYPDGCFVSQRRLSFHFRPRPGAAEQPSHDERRGQRGGRGARAANEFFGKTKGLGRALWTAFSHYVNELKEKVAARKTGESTR